MIWHLGPIGFGCLDNHFLNWYLFDMNSVNCKEQIKNMKIVESPISMGPALSYIYSIWKDSFTDGELFIFSRLKTENEHEFKAICSQISNLLPIETDFFDHFFQNEHLAHTSLNKLGIHENIRTKSTINKIPNLSLEGYFAQAIPPSTNSSRKWMFRLRLCWERYS